MKIALGIEYNGKQYCGWQRQEKVRSVQEELEKALSFVANEKIEVFCAGRTDSGVHGTGQVVHFETTAVRPEKAWAFGTNANLPVFRQPRVAIVIFCIVINYVQPFCQKGLPIVI